MANSPQCCKSFELRAAKFFGAMRCVQWVGGEWSLESARKQRYSLNRSTPSKQNSEIHRIAL